MSAPPNDGAMVNVGLDSSPVRGSGSSSQPQQQQPPSASAASSASDSSRAATPSPTDGPSASKAPLYSSGGSDGPRTHHDASASAATIALLAAIMGNVLEFYDFSVYAFFAPEIGKLFFPDGSPSARAVRTFTVFAGGFLMRPIGSVLLGAIGDRYGTAAALKWSIALMTIPTVVTGLLPSYHKVGMAAPFLLTICRLLQGLSVGGELIGALLHTSDHSPSRRHGFLCGLVAVFGSMGNLLGSLVSVGMRHAVTEEQLMSWGWRVPFLVGSVLGFVGILLRTQTKGLDVEEEEEGAGAEEHLPLHDAAAAAEEPPPSPALVLVGHGVSLAVLEEDRTKEHRKHESFMSVMRAAAGADKLRFLQVVVLAALNNAHFYFHFVWLGTYLAQLAPHPIPASQAFAVTCVAQACFILSNPLWGAMGDRLGGPQKRLQWNLAGVVLGCVLPPFLFRLVLPGRLPFDFVYAAVSGLLMGFVISGNYYAWVCEVLHHSPARVMVTSVAYNLGAITGGAYPMLASALSTSKVHTAPVLPVVVAAALGLVALLYLQRTLDRQKDKKKEVEMRGDALGRPGSGDRMLIRVHSEAEA